jgi:hypothetical protein
MEEQSEGTTFFNKVNILSELWAEYRTEPSFKDFIEYNDLGLPLAFLLSEELVVATERAEAFINESFSVLLGVLKLEDAGFESLDDMLVG